MYSCYLDGRDNVRFYHMPRDAVFTNHLCPFGPRYNGPCGNWLYNLLKLFLICRLKVGCIEQMSYTACRFLLCLPLPK